MKSIETHTILFRHHHWANLCLLEQCDELTLEQLNASIPGAYGSNRETLQHLVTSEQMYFSRISTGQRYDRPKDAPPLTVGEVLDTGRKTGSGLIEWAPKVQASDTLRIDWDGIPRAVPKTIILTQVINHATEHRAQVMTTMAQIGIDPPDLDRWSYFDQLAK